MKTENGKNEIVTILFSQKKVIFGTMSIFLAVSILIAFFWPRTYSSTTSILVRGKEIEKNPAALDKNDERMGRYELTSEDLSSEVEILTSFDLIKTTLLDLAGTFEANDRPIPPETPIEKIVGLLEFKQSDPSPETLRDNYQADRELTKQVYGIQAALDTRIIPASKVITMTYVARNTEWAKLFVETLVENYIKHRKKIHNMVKQDFYEDQVNKFKGNVEEINDELLGMIEASGITQPQQELENSLENKSILERQQDGLEIEAVEKKHVIKSLETALAEKNTKFFLFIDNGTLNLMAQKLQEEIAKRNDLLSKYMENAQPIVEIDHRISEFYLQLEKEVRYYIEYQKVELGIIDEKISRISEKLQEIDQKNIRYIKSAIAMEMNNKERELQSFSYESFSRKREEFTISDNSAPALSSVTILSNAYPSNGPVFPKKREVIPFGLISGLIAGIALGFIREYFDRTFKQPSDIMKTLDLPVIFSIPDWNDNCATKTAAPNDIKAFFQRQCLARPFRQMKTLHLKIRMMLLRSKISFPLSFTRLNRAKNS